MNTDREFFRPLQYRDVEEWIRMLWLFWTGFTLGFTTTLVLITVLNYNRSGPLD